MAHWRCYQRYKKAEKETSTPQVKFVEMGRRSTTQKEGWVRNKKIIANQIQAVKVAPLGKKGDSINIEYKVYSPFLRKKILNMIPS